MEAMLKRYGSINYHTKETIPNTKEGFFRISKQQTPGITDTPDTTSASTGKPDSMAKGMGNGNERVINSTSRHRWRPQSGIEAIFAPKNRNTTKTRNIRSMGLDRNHKTTESTLSWLILVGSPRLPWES